MQHHLGPSFPDPLRIQWQFISTSSVIQAAINQQFGIADFTNRTREIYGGNREMSFSRHSD